MSTCKSSLSLIILGFFLVGCGNVSTTSNPTSTTKKWTIMVYEAADNDLETDIFRDVNELELVGSSDEVNVVAQVDWWHYSGTAGKLVSGEGVGRFYITKDTDTTQISSTLVQALPETDTGTAEALKDFILWAASNYPAEHYLLAVGSHANGWRLNQPVSKRGFAMDFTSHGQASLYIDFTQLKQILPEVYNALGKNLDVFLLDTCNTGMIEAAYQIKDYIDIFISSEETIPAAGQAYNRFLQKLVSNPAMNATALATTIVDEYNAEYSGRAMTTLSALDLTKITNLAAALKSFTQKFNADMFNNFKNLINSRSGNDYSVLAYYDITYRDLWDLADEVIKSGSFETATLEAAAIKTAVGSAVITFETSAGSSDQYSVADSHGISIYIPTTQTTSYESSYGNLEFAAAASWEAFLLNL